MDEFLRSRLIGAGRRYRSGARFGRGQCLIVNLLRYFLLVDQQLVAMEIVLRLHIVRLGRFHLGLSGGHLPLGGDDSGIGIFDAGRGELQLA